MSYVEFLGASKEQINWGSNDDPNTILVVGKIYKVVRQEVHSWHTKLEIDGFPGKKFNSASFKNSSQEAFNRQEKHNADISG